MPMAGESAHASHPARAARLRFCTPPHTATAAKLRLKLNFATWPDTPPRTRDSRTPDVCGDKAKRASLEDDLMSITSCV